MATSVDDRPFNSLEASPMRVLTRCTPRGTIRVSRSDSPTRSMAHQQTPKGGYASSEDDEINDLDPYKEMIAKAKAYPNPSVVDPRDEPTADGWVPRDPTMVRLTGKHPFNAEAPLPRLMKHGFITPVPLHYVRNHGAVPRVSWEDWTVEVAGLVKRPSSFSMGRLVSEFTSQEFPVTLVCAGNRRKEQNMAKQSIGFNWGAGGVSTSVWRGVRLPDVLKRCGIMTRKNGALQVCFEGDEDLPGGGGSKYGTSIRREVAMDPANDIILAYMQNGEPLAPDHGFPVRVIVPGHIGGRMVKWLKKITVTSIESQSYYHFRDNRVLPSHIDAELANTEAWWYKPEYMINELNINSVITSPRHEEILPINSTTTQRPFTLKGYSYSGGGKKVTRAEVTMDGGDTWHVCKLDHPEKPKRYGKYWCWCFWSVDVEVLDLLGAKEIAVRAWDQSLNTQPEKLIWNVMGMMNNCWFRVKINVCKPYRGEIGIVFEHPTQPGSQSGGWMAKERQLEQSSLDSTLKKSLSSPFMTTSTQTFSLSEIKKHDSPDSAWIVVHGHVYDCTEFLKDHPGGTDSILINTGSDCTEEFDAIHSNKAKNLLEKYRIGELLINTEYDYDLLSDSSHHGAKLAPIGELVGPRTALVPGQKIPCRLLSKVSISDDVRVFRFALPSEDQTLGLPIGKHIFVCATINQKLCMRAYTPTSEVGTVGYFDLVIKIYLKNVHPRFPDGGLMSQYLDSVPIGSTVDVKGPLGHIEYNGQGKFMVHGYPKFARELAMVAGGTGITPIYQVVQAVLKDPEDRTIMFVVYANRTEDDILLRDDLDRWAKEHGDRLKVWYVVQESIKEGWEFSVGFITEGILRDHVPTGAEDVLALVCGPPPMVQFAVQPNLEKLNYDTKKSLLVF